MNRHGFRWRFDRRLGYFWINEAQFRWNHRDEEIGLPGQLKLGAWFHSAEFAAAFGDAAYWGNYGFYAIIDQMLYREPSRASAPVTSTDVVDGKRAAKSFKEAVIVEKSSQGLGWFGRIALNPQDRNFVGFYFDTGLVYIGLIPGRDDDALGFAIGYADLTHGAAQTLFDEGSREAGYEIVFEATYDAQITKWLNVQPDLQCIIRPGGTGVLGNALVLGVRVSVTF